MLEVKGLSVGFCRNKLTRYAVRNLSFTLRRGEVLAIIGESGSGKTSVALAVMGLLPDDATVKGHIYLSGRSLVPGREACWTGLRGQVMGMIFQNPATALNPVMTVGRQVSEVLQAHGKMSRKEVNKKVLHLFALLGILPAGYRFHQYPHQLSGGLQQRVMFALANAADPELVIADEPTSALDLTAQMQILNLLMSGVRERERALLLITHDLGVAARMADRVLVMYQGVILEEASVTELFEQPCHPYTRMLFESMPGLGRSLRGKALVRPPGTWKSPGCLFLSRCGQSGEACRQFPPRFYISAAHYVCCYRAGGRQHV